MVHDHAAPALIPGMGPFDDPALGQNDKASDRLRPERLLRIMQGAGRAVAGPTHDLDPDAVGLLDRFGALPAIRTIGLEPFEGGNFATGLRHDVSSAIAVLHAGSSHRNGQQQPKRVHHDVALPAFDLFASVIAAFATLR